MPSLPSAQPPPIPPPARVFHALADPTRIAMVEQLSGGPASVSELARPLGITLPGVLQHLAVLEGDGLVRSAKVGRVRTCRIEPAALRAAADWVHERRAMWERSFDRLDEYLAAEAARDRADSSSHATNHPKEPKP
ncbi:MAG TPA: metalloregulator ArsR/SmtB family transcription factor [Solirubrobacteraceae bacterium]|nr:metalloregulator ArsR/SmtB family transcription factor [Solirubrobacteraceae bacterium]